VNTNSDCPILSKLFLWSDADNKWLDQTASRIAPYSTWISGFSTTTGMLSVYQAQVIYQVAVKYQVKITFYDVLTIDPVATTKEWVFDVTVRHTCDTNPFTINEQVDVSYTTPAGEVDVSTATPIAKTVVSNQNTDVECWLSYRTDMWDDGTDKWVTLTATLANAAPRNTFITPSSYSDTKDANNLSYSSNAYSITLQFSNLVDFETAYPSLTIKMRNSVTDVTGRVLYDEY
jgi:hypothetical protein